jgi:hypothetical protein
MCGQADLVTLTLNLSEAQVTVVNINKLNIKSNPLRVSV